MNCPYTELFDGLNGMNPGYDPERHPRRSIRLEGYDYSQPGAYFITICTQNKRPYFEQYPELKEIVHRQWQQISNKYPGVMLDEFIVMPNHVHGIIIIGDDNVGAIHELPLQLPLHKKERRQMLLPKIIGFFKMSSSKQINIIRNTPGVPVWQRNYYEHIIRNEDKLNLVREYIINNPFQWQFDRENPKRIQDEAYNNQWGHFEEVLYGKTKE